MKYYIDGVFIDKNSELSFIVHSLDKLTEIDICYIFGGNKSKNNISFVDGYLSALVAREIIDNAEKGNIFSLYYYHTLQFTN